ncbi:MAG: VWA domain-containing protein [Spirochaetaceae bacterium]|jgi:hypothetical protein|nr:VWA domain-containing protein [Spirochaetaceae bacterium]
MNVGALSGILFQNFEHPQFFNFLLTVPLFIALFIYHFLTRYPAVKKLLMRGEVERGKMGERGEMGEIFEGGALARSYFFSRLFFLIFIVCSIMALASPRMGKHLVREHRRGADIALAVDISRSMELRDMPPESFYWGMPAPGGGAKQSRLERARALASEFVYASIEGIKTNSKALIPAEKHFRFALAIGKGKGYLAVPLTSDSEAVLSLLQSLSPSLVTARGTNLEDLLVSASAAFDDAFAAEKIIVLFSDGDALAGSLVSAAEKLKENGITLYTVGLGSIEGADVPKTEDIPQTEGAQAVKANGGSAQWTSALRQDVLMRASALTGGAYIDGSEESARSRLLKITDAIGDSPWNYREEAVPMWHLFLLAALFAFLLSNLCGKRPAAGLGRGAAALLVFFCFAPALPAQNFRPFTNLRTVTTGHFEFIYPPESEETARILVSRAEDIYERVSGLIGVKLTRRIAVSITPHTDEVNGYMNPVPYPHILIFDTPEFLDFTVYENTIVSLFTHELTHAVCAESRGKVQEALHKVFGGWVNMLAFNAPWFMIEGAAVAAESMLPEESGIYGRANDPLVKEFLRRDILEGAFKTPFAAEGAWDLPPGGNVYYYYGGLFCAYLIKKYGAEKFRELWRGTGSAFHFSPVKYNNGFYYIFKKVYNRKILDEWKDFEDYIKLDTDVNKSINCVFERKREVTSIADVASSGIYVYFLETSAGKIYVYNTVTHKTKALRASPSAAYALDVSPDGSRLLVSAYRRPGANTGQLSEARAIEYNTKNGFATGRVFKKIYQARYFRDGIIGIVSQNHKTNIAYRPFGKKSADEILLYGNAELVYGDIAPLDESRFAFIAAEKGRREISIFDYNQKAAWSLTDGKSGSYWTYVRNLRFSEGRLIFQYNDNDRMSKAGEIILGRPGSSGGGAAAAGATNTGTAYFLRTDYWGGIHQPVLADGKIYYKAAFSTRDALAFLDGKFDTAQNSRDIIALNLSGQRWSTARAAAAGLSAGTDAKQPVNAPNAAPDGDILTASIMSQWQPYHKIDTLFRFFNPLNLWVPLPYIPNINSPTPEVRGLGGFFYISDPFDSNLIFLQAYYDWEYCFVPLDIQWINFSFGFPIYFYYKDDVSKVKKEGQKEWRIINARIYLNFKFPIGVGRFDLRFEPGLASYHYIPSPEPYTGSVVPGGTAYNWERITPGSFYIMAGLILTNLSAHLWETFGSGVSAGAYMYTQIFNDSAHPVFEGILKAAVEPLPLIRLFGIKQTLYGTYSEDLMYIHGSTVLTGTYFSDVSVSEYSYDIIPKTLRYIAGGESEVKLISLEGQKSISHIYFNRVSLTAAYRWAWWGTQPDDMVPGFTYPQFLHSVIFRMRWQFSTYPVSVLNLRLLPDFYFILKLSSLDGSVNDGDVYKFGIKLNLAY